jgi:hypothetical protein
MGGGGWKNYIVPAVALVVLLVWFFIIQPRLGAMDEAPASPPASDAPATRTH